MTFDPIQRIRRFNRTVTRRIGALDESFLGAGLSLGKARVLYEIGSGVGEVRRLRERLGLDSGHMSRLLRSLERKRLITTTADPEDARARLARLTRAGRAKLSELEAKTSDGARSWLAPLGPRQRAALQDAMDEVVRLLLVSEVEVRLEDPRSPAARRCLQRFARELDQRFEAGFDVRRAASAQADQLTPPRGAFFLATLPDGPVGCVAFKRWEGEGFGEVKRMWVAPEARRLGVGRRLLEGVESYARGIGVRRLRLSTNRSLREAQALYRASGYSEIELFDPDEPYAHVAFEKRLG